MISASLFPFALVFPFVAVGTLAASIHKFLKAPVASLLISSNEFDEDCNFKAYKILEGNLCCGFNKDLLEFLEVNKTETEESAHNKSASVGLEVGLDWLLFVEGGRGNFDRTGITVEVEVED